MSYTVRLVLVCILSGVVLMAGAILIIEESSTIINNIVGIWFGTGGIGLLLLAFLLVYMDVEGDDAD